MTLKPFAMLVAAALALAACDKRAEAPANPAAVPNAAAAQAALGAAAQPRAAAPESGPSNPASVTPAPTPCGADKLSDYLNLLPTSTAKDEIAKTVGHTNIRYVGPNDVTTREFRADRLTADLGVDGRIKRFHCG